MACSKESGLDIALLSIDKDCEAVKGKIQPLVLSNKNPDDAIPVALVGYPDSLHFIDHDTREVFDAELVKKYGESGAIPPRKSYPYAKYVRADAVLKDNCNAQSSIFLHPATTTVGESGGVLLDLNTKPLQIIAFHTCCASYFSEPKGDQPDPELACAKIQRTYENQALKSWSVIQNSEMCKTLEKHKAPGLSCPN